MCDETNYNSKQGVINVNHARKNYYKIYVR